MKQAYQSTQLHVLYEHGSVSVVRSRLLPCGVRTPWRVAAEVEEKSRVGTATETGEAERGDSSSVDYGLQCSQVKYHRIIVRNHLFCLNKVS